MTEIVRDLETTQELSVFKRLPIKALEAFIDALRKLPVYTLEENPKQEDDPRTIAFMQGELDEIGRY